MKLNDNIKNKINFYYGNPKEYNFLSGLLNNKNELKAFLKPQLPSKIDRKQRRDRVLMMRIVYSLQKLAKKNDIMSIGKSDIQLTKGAFQIGNTLFNWSAEVVLAVLVSILVSVVVMLYFNLLFGIILLPILSFGVFKIVKQYVIEDFDKKVLELGSEMLKQDKNRYL